MAVTPAAIVTIRGTGEAQDGTDNLLNYVTSALDPKIYTTVTPLPYPAAVGMFNSAGSIVGPSEDESVTEGCAALAAFIRATPYPVGILAYSLGAVVASKFLEAKAQGQYQDCEIAWVGFVANPDRAPGEGIDPHPVGAGINGSHGLWPDILTWTVANPNDGITSCPEKSPLRDVAVGLSAFSFAALGGWTADLAHRLIVDDWPPADYTPTQLLESGQLVYGYLLGGQHTEAYIEGGYLDRLAAAINAQAGR